MINNGRNIIVQNAVISIKTNFDRYVFNNMIDYEINKRGPNTDPCGTSELTETFEEMAFANEENCEL